MGGRSRSFLRKSYPKDKSVRVDIHTYAFIFLIFATMPRSINQTSPRFGLGIPRLHFVEFDEKRVSNLHKRVIG